MTSGASPFFKTETSLRAYPAGRLTFFALVGLLLLAWLAWFFLVPLSTIQHSETAVLQSDTRLTATFLPAAAVDLSLNQPVSLILDGFPPAEHGRIPGRIRQIEPGVRDGVVTFEIDLLENPRRLPLQRGLTGRIEAETGRLTPAQLLWQTVSGQLAGQ